MIDPVPLPLSDRIAALVAEGGGTVTIPQAAKAWGYTREWLYRHARGADFPAPVNPGCRPLLYVRCEVDAWWRRRNER
jgi:predicted DNA-binding transcriptional regulator AlpA